MNFISFVASTQIIVFIMAGLANKSLALPILDIKPEIQFKLDPNNINLAVQASDIIPLADTPFSSPKNCGKPKITPSINGPNLNRIINGQPAYANSWPWMVSLRYYTKGWIYSHLCGGVLITSQHVLTAAHCLSDVKLKLGLGFNLIAVVGVQSSKLSYSTLSASNLYFASKYTSNSKFDSSKLVNDIAIVKLSKPVVLSPKVSIICLPDSSTNSDDILNKNVVLAGWGVVDGYQGSKPAENLRQAVVKVLNNETYCQSVNSNFNSTIEYCAINDNLFSNVCFGDSGGPLMYYTKGAWYSYGIISSAISNSKTKRCNETFPSFYTKLPKYLNWIGSTINNL